MVPTRTAATGRPNSHLSAGDEAEGLAVGPRAQGEATELEVVGLGRHDPPAVSYTHLDVYKRQVSIPEVRRIYETLWGVALQAQPGLRIPNMFDSAVGGSFKGLYVQGEDIAQSDPNTQHVEAALRALDLVVVHDLFLNETALSLIHI